MGCALLAAAYLGISVSEFSVHRSEVLLVVLLAAGGFGLGTSFATLIGHVMSGVPALYAPDISGVTSTVTQISGAIAVVGFGGLYLAYASRPGLSFATHSFAITTLALSVTALVSTIIAYVSTHSHKLTRSNVNVFEADS